MTQAAENGFATVFATAATLSRINSARSRRPPLALSDESNRPIEFVRSLTTGEHAVLFYEDPWYAEMLEFGFLAEGLRRGESCLITTHEDSTLSLKNRMVLHGLAVAKYESTGLLRVLRISDPMSNPRGVDEGIREVYDEMFSRLKEPFRIVSTTFRDLGRREVYEKEIELEKKAQVVFNGGDSATRDDAFRGMEGTIMCTYDVAEFGPSNHEWVRALSANHHAAVFAPRRGEGMGMRMRPVGE